jgi:hypothetical protein
VKDALVWDAPTSTIEDWENVPTKSIQIILYLMKHGETAVKFLQGLVQLETTSNLRNYCETRMEVSNVELYLF